MKGQTAKAILKEASKFFPSVYIFIESSGVDDLLLHEAMRQLREAEKGLEHVIKAVLEAGDGNPS